MFEYKTIQYDSHEARKMVNVQRCNSKKIKKPRGAKKEPKKPRSNFYGIVRNLVKKIQLSAPPKTTFPEKVSSIRTNF